MQNIHTLYISYDVNFYFEQKLEPLKNAPKLTSDMLTEKQKQAEEKREKVRDK